MTFERRTIALNGAIASQPRVTPNMPDAGPDPIPNPLSGPFQAIIFDLGGVIVAQDNMVLFERLRSRCHAPCPAERLEAVLREPAWTTGAAPISALHGRLVRDFGYSGDWPSFVEDWCCHFTLDRSMLAFVQRLAARHRVALFSNTNKEHWEFVDRSAGRALSRLEAYLSHEIGCAKPAVGAFERVAAKARIDPARSIFFDDLQHNVDGARRAGFQAELFTSEAQLAAQLAERGVSPG